MFKQSRSPSRALKAGHRKRPRARHLARVLECKARSTLLIDGDPNGSASNGISAVKAGLGRCVADSSRHRWRWLRSWDGGWSWTGPGGCPRRTAPPNAEGSPFVLGPLPACGPVRSSR